MTIATAIDVERTSPMLLQVLLQARTLEPALIWLPTFANKTDRFYASSDAGDDADTDDVDTDDVETFTFHERDVRLIEDGLSLHAVVTIPDDARGVVLFAHGANGDRFSPRNQFVARRMNAAGFATICADLLNQEEALDRINVFDIDLLASRITHVARWTAHHARLKGLPLALFGSNSGAAAALKAAAHLGNRVQAVISRGGRPDLASDILHDVLTPTLLIVGSEDGPLVNMNEWVLPRIRGVRELAMIEGADHLFNEDGALEKVADLSISWLERFLKPASGWKSQASSVRQAYLI